MKGSCRIKLYHDNLNWQIFRGLLSEIGRYNGCNGSFLLTDRRPSHATLAIRPCSEMGSSCRPVGRGVATRARRARQAAGTVSLTAFDVPYTQTFDTLDSVAPSSLVPTGWHFAEVGTNANTLYTPGNGAGNAGDTYSFGVTGAGERAFGGLLSGSLIPTIGAEFTNSTGGTITSLAIAYTGEQWRIGNVTAGRPADRLDFQLSLDATSLATGTWTDYDALDLSSPVITGAAAGALDGNAAANRAALVYTITGLSIANGSSFWVRWNDLNITGADDGLAVDDFSLTPSGLVPGEDPAPFVSTTSPANGLTGVPLASDVSITFSEAVDTAAGWYGISCATSGIHTAAVTGGPTTFTLNPDAGFAAGEVCTVTIFGAMVTDQDANDPLDAMASDYIFSFTVINDFCGDPFTPIYAVQGSGPASPLAGTDVAIEGIVVGDFQNNASPDDGNLNGFHVQDPAGDGNVGYVGRHLRLRTRWASTCPPATRCASAAPSRSTTG